MTAILDWLLEKENPSVRYFTLRHLLDQVEDDAEVQAARRAILVSEPVQKILAAQAPEGFWDNPVRNYSPKYRATSWQILFLAELGVNGNNEQVRRGCEYLIAHAQAANGGFSALAKAVSSGAIHCLNGNLIWALTALGYADDPRVQRAVAWLTGSITGEEFDLWNATVPGPGFKCGANLKLPCAWGAVKSLRALANLPSTLQSLKVKKAALAAADFLFSHELANADYPHYERVSGEWFKFGFPLSYTSDVLEASLVLCDTGYGSDPRLGNAVEFILSSRQADGHWLMKHSLNGKMWADFEVKGKPSKWVTLRALRVLKAAGREQP
jgi:hypothetical protein